MWTFPSHLLKNLHLLPDSGLLPAPQTHKLGGVLLAALSMLATVNYTKPPPTETQARTHTHTIIRQAILCYKMPPLLVYYTGVLLSLHSLQLHHKCNFQLLHSKTSGIYQTTSHESRKKGYL